MRIILLTSNIPVVSNEYPELDFVCLNFLIWSKYPSTGPITIDISSRVLSILLSSGIFKNSTISRVKAKAAKRTTIKIENVT